MIVPESARSAWASRLLRVSVAFAFAYAAIASFVEPDAWSGYLPLFLRALAPAQILLAGFSVFEIALSLWLLSGFKTAYAAALAALALAGIVAFNVGAMDVVFRDVSLALAALAFAVLDAR